MAGTARKSSTRTRARGAAKRTPARGAKPAAKSAAPPAARSGRSAKPAAASDAARDGTAADYVPPRPTLATLREAAMGCQACHLWALGTQTVFGEGPASADVMFVGEQPGDKEDRAGRPFVGPSGALLDAALEAAGIDRGRVYVTNTVKHFKWEQRGAKSARRVHKTPNASEITACRPWLEHEIALVRPRVIVALGATAARALLGREFRVTKERGKVKRSELAEAIVATVHPSSVLRVPDAASRERAEREFFADVKKVATVLRKSGIAT